MYGIILASPTTAAATALTRMPVVRAKWGGLIRPSTPNASCHIKSPGPETGSIAEPKQLEAV